MLILDAVDVSRFYDMKDAFRCVAEAAIAHVRNDATSSTRHAVFVPRSKMELLIMPAVIDEWTVGIKAWYAFAEEPPSLPRSSALILLIDPELGEVVMDASLITDLRTGAMTGLAAGALTPRGASTLCLIGAGIQARTQALGVVQALDSISSIRVFARNPLRRERFAAALTVDMRIKFADREIKVVAVESGEDACRNADIVVAATTSKVPVVFGNWLKPSVLVCGVGSHSIDAAEIDVHIIAHAGTVVVDTHTGAIDGAGDIAAAIEAGCLRRSEVLELGGILKGDGEDFRARGGTAVFKSVGFSAADIVSARFVAHRAMSENAGTRIPIHG